MPHYPLSIKSKLPKVGTTIFTVMSALANEVGAINLSQGFPDFESSPELIDLVHHYMKKGMNQYAPMQGIMPLREVISDKILNLYSAKYNPETEITITPGGTYAIYAAITSVINEGDEVIIFTPAYDCYAPAVEMNGGKPVYVQLKKPNYTIDWSEVKKVISRKTKMIIINTPHNPTGTILTAQDMTKLSQLTKSTDIVVLSDEVYEHIIFDKYEHQSVARFPDLAQRSFVIYSFGKTFHNTGWKMGYCLAPELLTTEFRKVHQYIAFSANTPLQYALASYMEDSKNYSDIAQMYQEKRDIFNKYLSGSRFKIRPSSGTYFQMLDYSAITDEKDKDFAIRLTKEFKVASVPVSVFYSVPIDNKMLRFCFAKKEETLEKAANILCKV